MQPVLGVLPKETSQCYRTGGTAHFHLFDFLFDSFDHFAQIVARFVKFAVD
jgi:hypothetical protein